MFQAIQPFAVSGSVKHFAFDITNLICGCVPMFPHEKGYHLAGLLASPLSLAPDSEKLTRELLVYVVDRQ
jgi:hypothetical protein